MKIALMHFRVYETDGVSLEMDKWRLSFEKMGHETLYISGSTPKGNDIYLEELDYRSDYNNIIHKNSFGKLKDFYTKDKLVTYIEEKADQIYFKLKQIIKREEIDCIIPNNMSSLGYNIPVGIAVKRLAEEKVCKIIYHHHDFYFERERYSTPLYKEIETYLEECFPYKGNATHCVINEIAKSQLKTRKDIDAVVVPNVFDFSQSLWEKDDYNKTLRSRFNIKETDIVFLQATRIVERKAIELGYRVIDEVNKLLPFYEGKTLYNGVEITKETKIHFVLAGMNELEQERFAHLDNLLQSSDITVHYINDVVDHNRNEDENVYSLWDVYTMCDFITYPSILEGWGNQLLEGLFAKKPMLVYEYPVFKTDIKKFGLNLITIDSELDRDSETYLFNVPRNMYKDKAREVVEMLTNHELYEMTVERNFKIGKDNLSYDNLYQILEEVIKK